MHQCFYDYVKPNYGENAKLCYVDTDSLIVEVKTDDIFKDIAQDVETRLDLSKYEIDRPLPRGKNEKIISLVKEKLGGQIMKEFVGLRAKTYIYLKENNDENKKAKDTKKCVIKRKRKFQDYIDSLKGARLVRKINYLEKKTHICVECLKTHQKYFVIKNYFEEMVKISVESLKAYQKEFVKKIILREQKRFKSEGYNVFAEVINKITLSSNDDKRMQSIDLIETYAYGTSKNLIWKKEKIERNNIIGQYENVSPEDTKEHNPKWSEIPDHLYRILIIGGSSGSGKTNALFNLVNNEPDIDKI